MKHINRCIDSAFQKTSKMCIILRNIISRNYKGNFYCKFMSPLSSLDYLTGACMGCAYKTTMSRLMHIQKCIIKFMNRFNYFYPSDKFKFKDNHLINTGALYIMFIMWFVQKKFILLIQPTFPVLLTFEL